jgi:CRISPR-associated endonuclease Cas1
MAATQTVPQYQQVRNFTPIKPQHGVITLFGYGIKACVDRGHLILEDGVGPRRRYARLPRIRHGLRRLVVIGSDGMVTLSALRWLADQDAAFVMLDRQGSVLATTGPVRPSDARLRRAQALAHQSGTALQIARELIGQKLEAQEKLARSGLTNFEVAETIASVRRAIPTAKTIDAIRLIESRGAYAYWSAWNNLPITFPKSDLRRVPDHWRFFRNRVSPLTDSPRLAANPVNAMLNYLYAILEAESRLAIAALGLDPGLGVMHMDAPARDSLAFDVMEPVRPLIDAYLLKWIGRETLKRDWFFEERDGNCRLMGSFAIRLSQTAPTWAHAVAPFAEMVARTLWSTIRKQVRHRRPATRLTQSYRREARAIQSGPSIPPMPRTQSYCRECGAEIGGGRTFCAKCVNALNTVGLIEAAKEGRIAAQSEVAQTRRSETQFRHQAEMHLWKSSDLPTWLDENYYLSEIQPRLPRITLSVLSTKLGVSTPYAVDIRCGRRVPHKRHWQALAQLIGVSWDREGVLGDTPTSIDTE